MPESERHASDPHQEFSMLDEIVTQTQRYSELLHDELPTKSTADEAALTEEEKWEREQTRLVPLMTGVKLKPYQIKGIKWLISMWQNGLNAILEDPMEFGAVIQTLGFLAHLKGNGLHGPYMIVLSQDGDAIPNWLKGIRHFPTMKTLNYFRNEKTWTVQRKEFMNGTVGPDFPIILTTYSMVVSDKEWFAHYKWKYVVLDESHKMMQWERKLLELLKPQPMGTNKLLLLRSVRMMKSMAEVTWYSARKKTEPQSLLKFALPYEFSSHEEFDSWFDFGDKKDNDQRTFEERQAHLSKLHAILRPFILRQMEDVENKVPQKKSATCDTSKVVQHWNAIGVTCSKKHATKEATRAGAESCQALVAKVPKKKGATRADALSVTRSRDHVAIEGANTGAKSCQAVAAEVPQNKGATCSDWIIATRSKDHAAIEGTRTAAEGCQELAAEVMSETGGESSSNMRSSQLSLEGNKLVKRQRTNDALIGPLDESNPAVHVQVRKSTSSELIFKTLKEIPGLARADILRAYSTLIRDDRLFESLIALPMDMRKDWLLMEIANK
ncbi:ATP-dependent DNA helicase DDM1-like [Lolium rigidum]|uniref:ATP-dependent DNA helicase DDM1-like n=1 Tax=Lolium rigidum TaxID=89674 RepID=UPI001F5C3FA5|nr:ATP-dependent DNA helicase DDM1-like [Lolium rigidum]XP_047082551.1 ATP-dependent DNA helicase DDM1-like [Lolium rigidum]